MRLQKYMAKCGVASRRKSETLIEEGHVKVNDTITTELGTKIDPKKDVIAVDGQVIKMEKEKIYLVLNKPIGYITTVSDQFNRPTVLDLVKGIEERIYPVGRLDYDTSGLLLLTNDGDLTYKLTHPKHEVDKKYIAQLKGIPTDNELHRFRQGLPIEDYMTSEAKITILEKGKDTSRVEILIHEGRNRQIRKMCDKIGHPVVTLERVAMGDIELKGLDIGKWRYLTIKEIEYLRKI